jgi:hypothetical protein
VSAERVALTPQCAECQALWLAADDERWRAYLGGDDLDDPAELAFYCPDCAEREFGGQGASLDPSFLHDPCLAGARFGPGVVVRPSVLVEAVRTLEGVLTVVAALEGGRIDPHTCRHVFT